MRIALVHLSCGVDGTPASLMVDHLGLESIHGKLSSNGHEVSLIDSGPLALDEQGILDALSEADPELVGFAVNYANAQDTKCIVNRVRRLLPGATIVAGGHYATFHADQLLCKKLFDAVILGEGETPLAEIAEVGASPKAWSSVAGIAWRSGSQIISNHPVSPPCLNDLPPANRSLLHALASFPRGCAKVAVEASRGCRHTCSFCSIAESQRLVGDVGRRRIRTPIAISQEIESINRTHGLKDFWFMDADFLGDKKDHRRILEIAEAIGAIGQGITFEIDARADSVNRQTIKSLKAAGLDRAFLGVESFDQDTLNSLSKRALADDNLNAIRLLEEEGVRPILGIIMFHPKSTLEQIQREHKALSIIGYEKTQMLFRLKKYKGSQDSGDSMGRGVSPNEDYGWEIIDPQVRLVWELFDRARLQLLDAIFVDLTKLFRAGKINVTTFQNLSDEVSHGLGNCMDVILSAMKKNITFIPDIAILEQDVDNVVSDILVNVNKIYGRLK